MATKADRGVMGVLRDHYGVVRGFILPALLIIGPAMLIAVIVARNSESCKKAKARGEKCKSIWWTSAEKSASPEPAVSRPASR